MRNCLKCLSALAAAVAMSAGAAEACTFDLGTGWTASGGGNPAHLIVLGGETCGGGVRGDTLKIIAPPQHGKIKVTGPSTYSYTPRRAYRGPDSFRVSAFTAAGLVIGTVAVTIE
jgi:hypothetical protein